MANFPVAFLPKRIIIIIGWDDSCAGGKSQREKKSCHRKPLLFLFLVFERTRQLEEEGKLRLEIDDDNFFFNKKWEKKRSTKSQFHSLPLQKICLDGMGWVGGKEISPPDDSETPNIKRHIFSGCVPPPLALAPLSP